MYRAFYDLALEVERASRSFPGEFSWLRSQMTRSSESVCANMAEGFYAQYSTEYLQSLHRCRREARELLVHVRYATDAGILQPEVLDRWSIRYEDALTQLNNVIRSIARKIAERGKAKPWPAVHEETVDYDPAVPHHPPLTINH